METENNRASMKKCRTGHERIEYIPPHLYLHLANTEPKRKSILKVHDLSTLGYS